MRGPSSLFRGRESPCGQCARFLPVLFVIANIAGLYLIYSFYHLKPLLTTNPFLAVIEGSIFNGVTLLLLLCYIRCILTSPGGIPDKEVDPTWAYGPPEDAASTSYSFFSSNLFKAAAPEPEKEEPWQERKGTGERRHCKWCKKYKPDRCHHCRVCGVCVLRMDHHCPWIDNCVGFRNHKFFFLLLLYSSVACNLIVWTMLGTVQEHFDSGTDFLAEFLTLFGETLAAFLGFLVTSFFLFHIWLMLKAMTTIEYCEKAGKKEKFSSSRYDRGLFGNVEAVLGDWVLLWLLPLNPPGGTGLFFIEAPVAKDLETGRDFQRARRDTGEALGTAVRRPAGDQDMPSVVGW